MPTIANTFNATGTFVCPTGVWEVIAECWGAGGGGATETSNLGGGGGAGGQYVKKVSIGVIPGTSYTVTVGTGAAATAGGDSWFNTSATVIAKGGATPSSGSGTGASGSTTGGIGDVVHSGGNAGSGVSTTSSGGGGGGAGSSGNGNNGSTTTGGAGLADSGAGAAGITVQGNGGTGSTPAGGGSGGLRTSNGTRTGGPGGPGRVTLTYTIIANPLENFKSVSAASGISVSERCKGGF